jgi:hypothetical protein
VHKWSLLKVREWAGGVAQVVESLASKYEALSSNPSTAKNQNKTTKKVKEWN